MSTFLKMWSNPKLRFSIFSKYGFYNKMDDKKYIEKAYKIYMGTELDLESPKTFSEKLQWLKLNDRNPLYSKLVDKYEVRKYISDKIGEKHLIPLLGVWNNFEDVCFDKLPNQFVLKCTHDSGGLVICRDKSKLNIEAAKKKIKNSYKRKYYYSGREWPYKNVKPRIIAEKYMVDEKADDLVDYKFYCFNGNVDNVMLCTGRQKGDLQFYFFDMDWNLLRINGCGKRAPDNFTLPKPEGLEEMVRIARKLSENIPFVRVDLYHVNGRIYFGEMTFFPASGFGHNLLPETDADFGKKLSLNIKEKNNENCSFRER